MSRCVTRFGKFAILSRSRETLVLIIALAIISTIAYLASRSAWRELVGHGLHRVAFRWITGHAINGKHYTDATWFKRATRVYHPTRHVLYWHHLPRIRRMGYRWLITISTLSVLYGLAVNRSFTLRLLSAMAIAIILLLGWIARCRIVRWHRHRKTVAPLADALASILGQPEVEAERAIALVPDYMSRKRGKLGDISLPSHFRALPGERSSVEHLVNSRMPIECDFLWNTRRNPGIVTIIAAPNPPDIAHFGEYVQQMEACKPGDVVIGLDRHRELFYGSFNLDDPHWGFSVGSGRGKSTFLQITCAQVLHNDPLATVDAIDPKMTSLEPLIGIPGVRVACNPRNIDEMWELVGSVKAEMFSRQDTIKSDPTIRFPAKLLVIDELNQFASMSMAHWRELKGKGYPAVWRDIASVAWMGRESNIHLIFAAQRLDDKATGGIGLKDSLGFRGLAGYRNNQWRMLIGTTPVPRSQRAKGRWIYSDGQTETWAQNLYAEPEEIRAYASARRSSIPASIRDAAKF